MEELNVTPQPASLTVDGKTYDELDVRRLQNRYDKLVDKVIIIEEWFKNAIDEGGLVSVDEIKEVAQQAGLNIEVETDISVTVVFTGTLTHNISDNIQNIVDGLDFSCGDYEFDVRDVSIDTWNED